MMPLPYRFLTSLMTRFNGSSLMIDCGEGTQVAVKEKGWSFKPIDVICFTHYHGDHISGLPGLLLTMGNADRREPLTLIGPKGLERVVSCLRVIAPELPFPIIYQEIQGAEIGVVFQEPQSCMDPLMKIGPQVEETLRIHTQMPKEERHQRAMAAMAAAELPDPEGICDKYPHELSGGMLQRAMIAAAIVNRPKLLLLDEPTTALDVTIQAQILEMLKKLNRESGVSMLFISHNLNVVRKLCRRVAVMQRGVLVEEGDTDQVFYHPQHPYTQKLIDAIPTRNRKEERP